MNGRRLFPDRHVQTVSFDLGTEEYTIYKAVTAYINEFLPQATGRRKNSVALARTVFQRRLASSMHAIHESLRRRRKKLADLLRELEGLSPAQRARRLAQLQGLLSDAEQDEDDLDETARDMLVDEATAAAELDQLRTELAELGDLVARVGRVRESGRDSKLVALRECLRRSEFDEIKDGRGKLLLFTEHRDTLDHLREHLEAWGYSTCRIHGGNEPARAQAGPGGLPDGPPDMRGHGGGRRRHQPSVLPPDDQLRSALEPDPPRTAPWPDPPHRADARRGSQ